MTSIKWKRKYPVKMHSQVADMFMQEEEHTGEDPYEEDWRCLLPVNKKMMLEDKGTKSKRLIQEGIFLAEQERYWEAINKFSEAISYTPREAKLFEMKAQALLEVGEIFPAIEAAEQAVRINPLWAEAYQTLGRVQISYGEIKMALVNFCKAFHLKPDLTELYEEDICWARELLIKKKEVTEATDNTLCDDKCALVSCARNQGTEIDEKVALVSCSHSNRTEVDEELVSCSRNHETEVIHKTRHETDDGSTGYYGNYGRDF